MADRRLHLNLVDSSAHLLGLDPGAEMARKGGCLLAAGSAEHPVIANAAFRRDDECDPERLLALAREFFDARGRGFSVWVRQGEPEDADLAAVVAEAGLQMVYAMPEMSLARRAEERPLPPGVELRRVAAPDQAEHYWQVAAAAYESLGFPPETFAGNTNHDGLLAENVAAFVAYLEGEPAGVAMTIVSDGVAGIYWVGSLERARGMGLGRAVTAAATNAGFDLGADVASLQASSMGRPIYERMGYEALYDYQLWMSASPGG